MSSKAHLPAVILLNASDNVAVAVRQILAGESWEQARPAAVSTVPRGHKISTRSIAPGEPILKYGQIIGTATNAIAPGEHVHTHNLSFTHMRAPASETSAWSRSEPPRSFKGFRRGTGRTGTRNYVAVLTSVNCSGTVARLIADHASRSGLLARFPNVDGVIPITHTSGCGMADRGEGFEVLRRTLWGTAINPNVGGVLLVGLGCEVLQLGRLTDEFGLESSDAFQSYTIQDAGGTQRAVAEGIARLERILAIANEAVREPAPASALMLGLQCGGSDGWSGITSNPALGDAAERLVALGGSVLLSETPEIYGGEHLLMQRAISSNVAEKLANRIRWWEAYAAKHGVSLNNNPSPGNLAGGLTTILEKSLGAIAKGGMAPLSDVIGYAEPCRSSGLVFMDSPGFDPCSATGQIASGANLIAFTTGRGSAFGSRPTPSIKLSSNTDVYERMTGDIDLDCGPIITGASTIPDKGREILDLLIDVASGSLTKSEELGYGGVEFVPWHLGAVL